MRPGASAAPALLALLCSALVAACADDAGASLERGDRLLSRGEVEAAIAEYRLAQRQRGEEPEVLVRLGQAHALRGDVGTAAGYYSRLLEQDSAYRHQVAADLAAAAREALDRGGRDRMARALQHLLPLGLEAIPADLRLELAHHYFDRQEFTQALPLYLTVLEDDPDVEPRVLYRTARSYEELGGCREALRYFRAYLSGAARGSVADGARWHYGRCLYEVGEEDRRRGEADEALSRLDRLVELGTPRTLMDRAHYLRGELLLEEGRREEALEAFREVLRLNPTRSSPLARAAEGRMLEIRYGGEEEE